MSLEVSGLEEELEKRNSKKHRRKSCKREIKSKRAHLEFAIFSEPFSGELLAMLMAMLLLIKSVCNKFLVNYTVVVAV